MKNIEIFIVDYVKKETKMSIMYTCAHHKILPKYECFSHFLLVDIMKSLYVCISLVVVFYKCSINLKQEIV